MSDSNIVHGSFIHPHRFTFTSFLLDIIPRCSPVSRSAHPRRVTWSHKSVHTLLNSFYQVTPTKVGLHSVTPQYLQAIVSHRFEYSHSVSAYHFALAHRVIIPRCTFFPVNLSSVQYTGMYTKFNYSRMMSHPHSYPPRIPHRYINPQPVFTHLFLLHPR